MNRMNIRKLSPRALLFPVLLCLVGTVAMVYYYFFTDVTRQESTHYLYIDSDDSLDSLCEKMADCATKHSRTGIYTLLSHTSWRDSVRTGRYAVEPGMSTFTLFRRLKNGQQTPLRLTLPESRTMERLARQLGTRLMADSAALIGAMRDTLLLSALGFDTCTVPALFVPNTYEVYWNTTVDNFMKRMKREYDSFWNYERRHKATAQGLSPVEVATLASIIDEETANTREKPMIAGMYLNRLRKGMPLQADPTVKFALGDFAIRRIRGAMLDVESPYNTYRNTGLPPGPIKVASVKGIDAVLNAVQHDYLYMCAKEDFSGTHNFARTYREHQENARRYVKALNERGIE